MSYSFKYVKRFKRGATHRDGTPWLCVRCGYEKRRKRKRAVLTAFMQYAGSSRKLPVGYCEDHIPPKLDT